MRIADFPPSRPSSPASRIVANCVLEAPPTLWSTTRRTCRWVRTRSSRIYPAASGGESRRASGYKAVIVNGVQTIDHDTQTGNHSGRLLRHGKG